MENEHFPGIGEIREFQQGKKRHFSSKSGHSKVKDASYRKVSVYTKSMERYMKERERRRQVRLLAEKGFSQKQIASELGVSTRTVKRDWDKIRPYVKGQTRKEIRAVVDERQKEFERRYEGLTVNEELKLLKQDIRVTAKKVHRLQANHTRQELRQQPIRQLDYVLDLDSPTADGFPLVIFPFQGNNMQFTGDFEIRFSVIKNGEKREICNVGISTNTTAPFHSP